MRESGSMIFHITSLSRWQQSLADGVHTESTRGVELAEEGFIHCSTATQLAGVLQRYYVGVTDLVVLHINESLLTSELVVEQLPGAPEAFPHVYGPVNIDAVVDVSTPH
jgi:uncharacterized protein (DUF952 family)